MKEKDLTARSKYLSLVLRHKPEAANITLDKEGWAIVDELVFNNVAEFNTKELDEIVENDSKGRYEYNEDKTKIRARQGHSKGVADDMTLEKVIPPGVLYHGTKEDVRLAIAKDGLKPMNRNHVHLTDKLETANRRKGKSIILQIDAAAMRAE